MSLSENIEMLIITHRCSVCVNCDYKSYNGTEEADDLFI